MAGGFGEVFPPAPGAGEFCPFCLRGGIEEGCFVLHEGREHPVCRPCWERILLRPVPDAAFPADSSPAPAGAPDP